MSLTPGPFSSCWRKEALRAPRIQRAQLAKLQIDYGGMMVSQTYPARLPELWSGRPVIVYGRYAGAGDAVVSVSGEVEGEPTSWQLTVAVPKEEPAYDVLAKVWARQKIEDLMHQSFYQGTPAVEEEVTGLALQYRLMSQYTSFVAVDSDTPPSDEPARAPRQMLVPVPLPEGTRWEGFFGGEGEMFGELEESKQEARFGLSPATAGRGLPQAGERTAYKRMKKDAALYDRAKLPALRSYNMPAATPLSTLARDAKALSGGGGGFGGLVPSQRAQSGPASPRARVLSERIEALADLEAQCEASEIDKNALTKAVGGELSGDDQLVLAALACRRAAGDTWQAFRREAQRLLGSQPLRGEIVVLINRLDASVR